MQDVVVELSYGQERRPASKNNGPTALKSAYAGWTGMPSKPKGVSLLGRNGINGSGKGSRTRESDTQIVEIDDKFGHLLGLANGQKVRCSEQTRLRFARALSL